MLRTRSAAACGAVLRHWNSAAAIDTKNMNARWTRMMTTSLEYLSALRWTEKKNRRSPTQRCDEHMDEHRARSENCVISHKPQVSGGVNRFV
jgi:hypothetical protein